MRHLGKNGLSERARARAVDAHCGGGGRNAEIARSEISRGNRAPGETLGRLPNRFLGLSLSDRTILFLVILLDKTVSVG